MKKINCDRGICSILIVALIYILNISFTKEKKEFDTTKELLNFENDYNNEYINEISESYQKTNGVSIKKSSDIVLNVFSKRSNVKYIDKVGVLKDKTCGDYEEIYIYLDCEDDNDPYTKTYGWTGATYSDDRKNLHLKICVVEANSFSFVNGVEYSVLMLSDMADYNLLPNTDAYCRLFTQEKKDNQNKLFIDNIESALTWYGDCYFGRSGFSVDGLNHHTSLTFFRFYDAWDPWNYDHGDGKFPDLGFSYGVFGRFGSDQGYISIDDEDTDKYNDNSLSLSRLVDGEPMTGYSGTIKNFCDAGDNSFFYVSKVDNCFK